MLDKVHVATAAITGEIYIGRINKAGDCFTSKRNATNEAKKAVIEHMMHGTERGATQKFSWDGGKTQYELTVQLVPKEEMESE